MIDRNLLEQIIRDYIAGDLKETKPRRLELPLDINRVIAVSGARRTGKTSLLFHTIRQLRQELEQSRLLYINFEDDRLFRMEVDDFDVLLEIYFSNYPGNRDKKIFLFFDEIQRITGWEAFVRRIMDTINAQIYITGSSASLLSKEIATSLRGRTLTYEVFPLEFSEYLQWNDLPIHVGTSAENAHIRKAFDDYLHSTAFPELMHWRERERLMAMQEYIDLILYRDVAERLKETNIEILKYLIHHLLVNASNNVSINNIYKDLKGQGLSVSKNSLYEYMGLLQDVYAIFMVPVYTKNLKVRQRNPRKLYILDHGLKMAVSMSKDQGSLLENIIFLALRRKHKNIFYWQKNQEVDFVVGKEGQMKAINVCLDMTDSKTRDRELKGMLECMRDLEIEDAAIVTKHIQEIIDLDGKQITVVPAWKWLLD